MTEVTYYRWRQEFGGLKIGSGEAAEGPGGGERPAATGGVRPDARQDDPGRRPPGETTKPFAPPRLHRSCSIRADGCPSGGSAACSGSIDPRNAAFLRGRDDEERLTADIVELARQYGRYGYRKIAELLRTTAGWVVNDKRVERIWRREGLKVPPNNPNAAGSGWRTARACGCAPSGLTMSGLMTSSRIAPMMEGNIGCSNIIDEFTHECLAIRIRSETQVRRRHRCALRPVHPARRSRAPSLGQRTGVRRQGRARLDRGCRSEDGLHRAGQPLGERLHRELQRSAPGRAARMGRFSIRSRRPGSSSKAGGATTTPNARTRHWATSLQRLKCSCPRSPRGRLRNPGQLRRPR